MGEILQPTLNINYKPKVQGGIDEWARATCLHNGVTIQYHKIVHQMVKNSIQCKENSKKVFSSIPFPPKMTLNMHNIGSSHKVNRLKQID